MIYEGFRGWLNAIGLYPELSDAGKPDMIRYIGSLDTTRAQGGQMTDADMMQLMKCAIKDLNRVIDELKAKVSAIESKLSKLTTYNVTPFIPYYNEDTAQSP